MAGTLCDPSGICPGSDRVSPCSPASPLAYRGKGDVIAFHASALVLLSFVDYDFGITKQDVYQNVRFLIHQIIHTCFASHVTGTNMFLECLKNVLSISHELYVCFTWLSFFGTSV